MNTVGWNLFRKFNPLLLYLNPFLINPFLVNHFYFFFEEFYTPTFLINQEGGCKGLILPAYSSKTINGYGGNFIVEYKIQWVGWDFFL